MKKVLLILVTGLLLANASMSQTDLAEEKIAAEATINLYFDGWATGDTAKVGKAMHTTCHLKFYREGKFTDMDRATYLGRFKQPPHERDKDLVTRIAMLDITGNIASAKAEIITVKDIFTDYFNLIKTDAGWCIVDKVSVKAAR